MQSSSFHPAAIRLFFVALAVLQPVRARNIPNPDATDLPPRTVAAPLPSRPVPAWIQTHLRVGHLPGELSMQAEFLKDGYNLITISTLSRWEIVGPSAGLYPPDRVQEAMKYLHAHVERCHAAGAKAIFYLGPVQAASGDAIFAAAHPDWLRIRPNGKPDPTPNFANINTGYTDWLHNQLAYLVREFKVDGFWFDGCAPAHLHSYDPVARDAFRKFSGGHDLPLPLSDKPDHSFYYDPVSDPVTRQYMAWHEDRFVHFVDGLRGVIRRENPECIIYANHSANRTWYFPNMYMGEYPLNYTSVIDIPSVELYWDIPGDPLYQQFVYAFMQGISHERGATVWIQPAEHGTTGISSPVEIQLRGLEGTPWGVYPEFVESTGREEYHRLHVANIAARETWMENSRAVSYVGILASDQTRTLYARGALPVYFSHTLGAFKACLEKHIPVRVLTESDVEDANLEGIRVLMLPDVAVLSDRAAEVIRRFVRGGGGLVATFETSLYDENFKKRADFALGDLLHARYVDTHTVTQRDDALQITLTASHPIVEDQVILAKQNTAWRDPGHPPARGPLALVASATEVTAADGGTVLATYRTPGPDRTSHPAVIVSEFGQGRVAYFPASIDKGMFFYPDAYMREMLANAIRWTARDEPPLVEVNGPLILTTTVRRQDNPRRLIVHLLNEASSWGMHSTYQKLAALPADLNKQWGFPNQSELRGTWPIREEIIPLGGIRVTCHQPGITKATLQPGGIELPLQPVTGGVEVTVENLGMHAMVIFE